MEASAVGVDWIPHIEGDVPQAEMVNENAVIIANVRRMVELNYIRAN